jgi:hypothetical protein
LYQLPLAHAISETHDSAANVLQDASVSSSVSSDDDDTDDDDAEAITELVPDSVREVGPSVHQSIIREKGETILEHWFNSRKHMTSFEEMIDDMITSYQDGCRKDQLQDVIAFLTLEQKYKLLIHLIKKRHPLPEDRMFKGIELLRAYRDKFGTDAVAGL